MAHIYVIKSQYTPEASNPFSHSASAIVDGTLPCSSEPGGGTSTWQLLDIYFASMWMVVLTVDTYLVEVKTCRFERRFLLLTDYSIWHWTDVVGKRAWIMKARLMCR